jgi:hypothetical protein
VPFKFSPPNLQAPRLPTRVEEPQIVATIGLHKYFALKLLHGSKCSKSLDAK